jgi:beta-mannosidase
LSFGDAWHDDGSGDMHMWSVWHEGRDFDHYRDMKPRFCSEFGFQSYPSMDVIRRFADPADWNIASPVMEAHQKNAGGNARIAETMFRYFRFPVTFPDFVWLSQVQQGVAIKTAVTAWRGLRPHCMGTLYWQLNDTWPCCSWSSLDHGGGWKLLHHMARHFYAPVTVVALPEAGRVRLVGVNDTARTIDLAVTVSALAMDGTLRRLGEGRARVGDAATEVCAVALDDLRADEILLWDWRAPAAGPPTPSLPHEGGGSLLDPPAVPGPAPDPLARAVPEGASLPPRGGGMGWGGADTGALCGADHWAPVPWKALPLAEPQARMAVVQDGLVSRITLTAAATCPFATVEADLPGRFSDNAVLLVPGRPVTITFTPQAGGTPSFTLRHLHSATYGG